MLSFFACRPPASRAFALRSLLFIVASLTILLQAAACGESSSNTDTDGSSSMVEVLGPEACHALDTEEACRDFRGHITFDPGNGLSEWNWDRCDYFWLNTAGPESTCLTRRERAVCIPTPLGNAEEEIWIELDDGESIAVLSEHPHETVFPPGFGGVPALPRPPDFERRPLTESQQELLRDPVYCD